MNREIYNFELAGRLACPDEDRERCAGTLYAIMAMASAARKNGLPAIGKHARNPKLPELLREAVALMAGETTPGAIRDELESRVGPDDAGAELLEKLVIVEGTDLLLDGCNPETIFRVVSSLFGDEYAPRLRKYISERARK